MMRKLFFILFTFLLPGFVFSQNKQSLTSAEIYQSIKKLNVLGSVLYIAAHPDDENTRLITYLSKDKLYRTGYLSLTRGDGGQNLIGEEQGIELGLIRTQELLAARKIDGGEQFFTRAFDFGYSKTPEETFTKWDKEKILSDVVWVIRKFQPDVIVSRFPTTGEGGHGHHTASAILANEAFEAAADSKRFPEQFKYGVKPWQVKRVLWNTFNFGGNNTTRADQFKIDVGGYNALLGKSYGEIAAEGRSQHKSQGFGSAATRGETLEFFKATKGDQPVNDLLDGVDISWNRVFGGDVFKKKVDSIAESFDFIHPENSVKRLTQLYAEMNERYFDVLLSSSEKSAAEAWIIGKTEEVRKLIQQCSGLFVDATANQQFAVQTDSVKINFVFNNRLGIETELQKIWIDKFDTTLNRPMEKNKNISFSKTIYVPADKPISQPFWLKNEMTEGYYQINEQDKIGQAETHPSYIAIALLKIAGVQISFQVPVRYKFTDAVKGEVYQPLVVMPSFTMKINPELIIAESRKKTGEHIAVFDKIYTSYKQNNTIRSGIGVKNHKGLLRGFIPTDSITLSKETRTISEANIIHNDTVPRPHDFTLKNPNIVTNPSERKDEYYDRATKLPIFGAYSVSHEHLPAITYFRPTVANIRYLDVKTYNKKIGYITGAGDKVAEALEQMGYEVIQLGDKELSKNNLQQYDAIITGVRAYNTHEWMNKHYDKLMKYVSDGGNLIVQYNTSNQIGPVRAKIGPYNFNITRNRITDETAAVTILKPEHQVFNFPNKITQDDFGGWVQERSIYHATDTSGKFEKLISMADPGEKPDDGSLLVTKYGKGWFTYTGLVFFRQLPAGVHGAYRLLANIIALNKKKGF